MIVLDWYSGFGAAPRVDIDAVASQAAAAANALASANAREIARLRALLRRSEHAICCAHQKCHRCGLDADACVMGKPCVVGGPRGESMNDSEPKAPDAMRALADAAAAIPETSGPVVKRIHFLRAELTERAEEYKRERDDWKKAATTHVETIGILADQKATLANERDEWRARCETAERELAEAGVRGSPPVGEATIPRLIRERVEALACVEKAEAERDHLARQLEAASGNAARMFKDERDEARAKYQDALTVLRSFVGTGMARNIDVRVAHERIRADLERPAVTCKCPATSRCLCNLRMGWRDHPTLHKRGEP